MKPMVFFIRKKLKKKFKMAALKKVHFPILPIFILFEKFFPGIGPWVSRID